ncbi:MAG: ComF family protein [Muribaculaceae bacterium]
MARRGILGRFLGGVAGLLFPHVCEVCGETLRHGEEVMCLHCLAGLPRTMVHREPFNTMHERVAGHVPVERAASYFYYYHDSPYRAIIHQAKYASRPVVARCVAAMFAREIAPDGFFDGIDLLLPVPLHWRKLVRRGYNQSEAIAEGIADVIGLPIGGNLVAARSHGSQTARGAYARWINTRDVYDVDEPVDLAGRHVLVIDDVMTTGATLLACIEAIHRASPTTRISLLTLALARLT